jgi:uncharacterized protein (DUF1499 family)
MWYRACPSVIAAAWVDGPGGRTGGEEGPRSRSRSRQAAYPTPMIDAPLEPCPSVPNCVSSEADPQDALHYLAPLPLPAGLAPEAALDAFERRLRATPRVEIVWRRGLRLHATARTLLLRFVDDVDVRVDPGRRLLHVRSASRVGRGDLGTNRARVEAWLRAQARDWGLVRAQARDWGTLRRRA